MTIYRRFIVLHLVCFVLNRWHYDFIHIYKSAQSHTRKHTICISSIHNISHTSFGWRLENLRCFLFWFKFEDQTQPLGIQWPMTLFIMMCLVMVLIKVFYGLMSYLDWIPQHMEVALRCYHAGIITQNQKHC